ncbi:MAG: right-handed parallel beta-helix repeat-containing protein, partial [Candidatus Omnitrophica bacterium]|nr:right-handed parallel beta-helix repeat-containing protein [Candidatus Omnitrophota bacterium]
LFGGGIRMSGSNLVVANCVVENNAADTIGGGIYAFSDSTLHVADSIIQDNSTTSAGQNCGGGGISIGSNSSAFIMASVFLRNYTECSGGALEIFSFNNSSAEIVSCRFEENFSGGLGHAITGEVSILSCTFELNGIESDTNERVLNGGGSGSQIHDSIIRYNYGVGVYGFHGGVSGCEITDNQGDGVNLCSLVSNSEISRNDRGIANSSMISDCVVQDNEQVGIHASGEILRCLVSGNGNGGISTTGASLIENCLIFRNDAIEGGGVSLDADGSTIRYCTVVNNQADQTGGGIVIRKMDPGGDNIPSIIHSCIVTSNQLFSSETSNIERSTIFPGAAAAPEVIYSLVGGGFEGEGNIDADPMFVDPEGDDYRLLYGSPCIDSASTEGPGSDLDGRIRPIDITGIGREGPGAFDMGAFEFDYSRADLNEDGKVDELDLMIFQQDWYRQIEIQ